MEPDPNPEELRCLLALSFAEKIGSKTAGILLRHYGSAVAVMAAPPKEVRALDGVGEIRARALRDESLLRRADAELAWMARHAVHAIGITDPRYPQRFAQCADPSTILYYRGDLALLNFPKTLAIIGTRKNTDYGQRFTEELIDHLRRTTGLVVVSGLAYGIDAIAHRQAVKVGLPTLGVVGHGLDRMYPDAHRTLAKEMLESGGGLLTEFPHQTALSPSNFPVRNRIVAGISDATLVVESDEKGGAMITAYMAASYNREVCALPGRVYDAKSAGPNKLIRMNIASAITGATDLLNLMSWAKSKKEKVVQPKLLLNLSPDEQQIVDALEGKDGLHADELLLTTGLGSGALAATLLTLEMQGLLKSLPGKFYRLN